MFSIIGKLSLLVKIIIVLLILGCLYWSAGVVCFHENHRIAKLRVIVGMESGCKFVRNNQF